MEGMEKQTAVDWLVNELKSNKKKHLGYKNIDIDFKNIIEQAKEMEKEEQRKLGIILAIFAEEIGDKKFTELLIKAEQYYNETFKSE
jgi:hypothetical protein